MCACVKSKKARGYQQLLRPSNNICSRSPKKVVSLGTLVASFSWPSMRWAAPGGCPKMDKSATLNQSAVSASPRSSAIPSFPNMTSSRPVGYYACDSAITICPSRKTPCWTAGSRVSNLKTSTKGGHWTWYYTRGRSRHTTLLKHLKTLLRLLKKVAKPYRTGALTNQSSKLILMIK